MEKLNLSICVVTYESIDLVKRFHEELISSLDGFINWEVLYFDNSQSNDVYEFISNDTNAAVDIEQDKRNLGFSYGNNRLIINSKYENILLLNPDVFDIKNSFWTELASKYNNQDVLFIKLLNEDGSFQDCIGKYSSVARMISKREDYSSIKEPISIEMGIMAFMLTTKKVFSHVGLLDCNYPLYAEDMDWCYRANKMAYKVTYDPSLVLTHVGGGSSKTRWQASKTQQKKFQAERIFIKKHYNGLYKSTMLVLNQLKMILNGSGLRK